MQNEPTKKKDFDVDLDIEFDTFKNSVPPILEEAIQNEPLCSLEETIGVCLDNPEFMREYKRLSGASLGFGSPITMMIDKATGYDEVEAKALYEFIRDYIWKPVIAQVVMEQVKEQNAE